MNSIRLRLFAILALVTAAVWGTSVAWIQIRTQTEIQHVLDRRLMESARMVSSLLEAGDVEAATGLITRRPRPGATGTLSADTAYDRQLSCQIWSLEGELVGRSDGAPDERLALADGFSERDIRGERWRVYTVHNREAGVRVMVGDNLSMRDHLVGTLITGLVAPAILGLLALGALIWWSVGRGLAPIRSLTKALGDRDIDALTPLSAPGTARELRPFVFALNNLIGRLDAARRRETEFTAAAAHELRTPLAGLRIQAQIAATSTDPGTRRRALDHITGSVDRTARLVTQLLEMARQDAMAVAPLERLWIPADRLVSDVGEPDGPAIVLDASVYEFDIQADPDRVAVVFGNILTNARTHGRMRVMVELHAAATPPYLAIEDDGLGVAFADLHRLGRRFFRAANAPPGGHGLGLSIAEASAAAHGWTLRYLRGRSGGLRVEVTMRSGDLRCRR